MRKCKILALCICFAWPAAAQIDDIPWETIATVESIVRGSLLPLPDLPPEDKPTYVRIEIKDTAYLKGNLRSGNLSIQYFINDAPWNVSHSLLSTLQGSSVIAMVSSTKWDNQNYFPNQGNSALIEATEKNILAVQSEIEAQEQIIQNWAPDISVPHYKTVGELTAKLANSEQQAGAALALEKLGIEAVPAIVLHMDSREPMGRKSLSFVNYNLDAFEGTRHYGPELVADSLAAILNQITGKSFGHIYSGAEESERIRCINGWRIYSMRSPIFENTRPSKVD